MANYRAAYLDDVEGALVAQVDAVLVLLVHELARLELQALHARLQLSALSGARLEEIFAGNSNMVFLANRRKLERLPSRASYHTYLTEGA